MERHRMTNTRKVLLFVAALCIVVFLTGRIAFAVKEYQTAAEEEKRKELYDHILDAAATKPTELTTSFTHPTSKGSPMVFGGAHAPNANDLDAWEKINEIGLTMVRVDLGINRMIRDTNIAEYKNNGRNIQDIKNWNTTYMQNINKQLETAKKYGMKTIGIIDYSPPWLNYDGTDFGVPRDWGVFKDLVRKTYEYYRDDLDFVEIWNEPSYEYFLRLTNSGLTREEAYLNIFKNAVTAVREIDQEKKDGKKIKIGGPVAHMPSDTLLLNTLLNDNNLKEELDFISYHNYSAKHMDEPSDIYIKKVLADHKIRNIPIFVTEWNYHPTGDINYEYMSKSGLTYSANKFIEFLKMNIYGACYFSLEPKNDTNIKNGLGGFSFYSINDGRAELVPQAKSWRILSRDMGLGKGQSDIFTPVTEDTDINSLGFTNSDNDQGIALVNPTSTNKMISMRFDKLNIQNFAKVQVFYASSGNDAKVPVYEGTLRVQNGQTQFDFYVPKETVMGVKLSQEKDWFNVFGFK